MRRITAIALVAITLLGSACSKGKAKVSDNESAEAELVEQIRNLPDDAIAFDYGNHLYFDVVVRDSIPARMIFDTGNTNLLIENQFFKKYFAPSETLQRAVIQGTGNSLEAVYRDLSDWTYRIGEYTQTENGTIVMDLRKILGNEVDGMFGMEFMRGKKVEFNYADEYMRIMPQEEQPKEGYTCIKCKWLDKRQTRMLMPMKITIKDGVIFEGNFLVDMGSRAGVALNSSLAAKLNLGRVLTDVKKKIYDVGGVGGSRTDYLFNTERISLAGYEIEDFHTEFSANTSGMMADDRYNGLIGNELLERFDVIFDFAKCEIWLRPNKNFNTSVNCDSGMTLTPQEDGWVVNGLIEGGNAHREGVRRGDKIISINGLAREKVSLKELKRMNRSAEDWKIVIQGNNSTTELVIKKEEI